MKPDKPMRELTITGLDALPPVHRVGRAEPVSLAVLETQIRDLLQADFSREQAFRNESVYDRVAVGLCLLKGRELHLRKGGRPQNSGNVSTVSKKAEDKAEISFNKWIEESFPAFTTRTARNYMNGARNCGLTSDHGLEDVQALRTAQALHDKTAKELYKLADALKTPEKAELPPVPNLVADVTRDLFAALDQALQLRDQFEPDGFEAVTTRTLAFLEKWTGARWVMGTGDDGAQHGDVEIVTAKSAKAARKKPAKRGSFLSPAARAKIAAAQKARWAKHKGGK